MGEDVDHIPYMKEMYKQIDTVVPQAEHRIGIFYSDIGNGREARAFKRTKSDRLNGGGFTFQEVFPQQYLEASHIVPETFAYMKGIYRASKGKHSLAQAACYLLIG